MTLLTEIQENQFKDQGFLILKNLFDEEEIKLLKESAIFDKELDKQSVSRLDGNGKKVRLALWNHPGDGIYGMFARCNKLVNKMEQILGGEVYHYHSKMILKDPEIGGAWEWHQDYGYWYNFGCLQPLMASAMIAVDQATKENGCLQVLRGSHHLGRIDHTLTGDQAGADRERVDIALQRFDRIHVELNPGDVILFHCNLLHRSDQNSSKNARWAMICCYNAARNNPFKDSIHPQYTPLNKVPDCSIKKVGVRRFENSGDVNWMNQNQDRNIVNKAMTS